MSVYLDGTSVLLDGTSVATGAACCCGCCPTISQVFVDDTLSHMIQLGSDPCDIRGAFYPPYVDFSLPNQAGDAGVMLVLEDLPGPPLWTVYTPDFLSHPISATGSLGVTTPFTIGSQNTIGSGTEIDPYITTTTGDAGGSATITRIDTWWIGSDTLYSTVLVSSSYNGTLYCAGDIFLADCDFSYGVLDATIGGSVGAYVPAGVPCNGRTQDFERVIELVGGGDYFEGNFDAMWSLIGGALGLGASFPNTYEPAIEDAGVGLSVGISPGDNTFSYYTKFSCL